MNCKIENWQTLDRGEARKWKRGCLHRLEKNVLETCTSRKKKKVKFLEKMHLAINQRESVKNIYLKNQVYAAPTVHNLKASKVTY